MKVKLESFLQEVSEKTTENNQYPVLTSSKAGLYLQSDYFNKQVASKDNTGYKIIKRGQFTYRAMSDTGEFFPNMLDCIDIGIVSPAYPVFEIAKPIVIPEFLKYYFKSNGFQQSIASFAQGSTRTSIKYEKLKTVLMELPDLKEQQRHVEILDTAQRIINDRKKEIEKLDDLIKARFVELFGDPVSNPKGWNMVELGELTGIGSSKRIFEKEYVSEGIPFYRTKEIVELSKGNSISTELYITEERFAEIKKQYGVPKAGDLLISAVGTIGVIWIVDGKNDFYFKDGNLIRVDGSEKFNSVYMKNLLEHLIAEYKKQMSSGTAYAALTISGLTKMKVYDVPMDLQNYFADFVHQVDKSKFININIIPEGGFYNGDKFYIS